MREVEWTRTLEDGRVVKFTCLELAEDGAFITAQLAGNEVLLAKARNPLSREAVESHFKCELSKKIVISTAVGLMADLFDLAC